MLATCIPLYTGWWFQTFFIFHNIWDNPSHWLSYFSRWLKPPTSINDIPLLVAIFPWYPQSAQRPGQRDEKPRFKLAEEEFIQAKKPKEAIDMSAAMVRDGETWF